MVISFGEGYSQAGEDQRINKGKYKKTKKPSTESTNRRNMHGQHREAQIGHCHYAVRDKGGTRIRMHFSWQELLE